MWEPSIFRYTGNLLLAAWRGYVEPEGLLEVLQSLYDRLQAVEMESRDPDVLDAVRGVQRALTIANAWFEEGDREALLVARRELQRGVQRLLEATEELTEVDTSASPVVHEALTWARENGDEALAEAAILLMQGRTDEAEGLLRRLAA